MITKLGESHSVVSDYVTPWTAARQAPVHGILQARVLEWVAIPFFTGLSQPRDQTCTAGRATKEAHNKFFKSHAIH